MISRNLRVVVIIASLLYLFVYPLTVFSQQQSLDEKLKTYAYIMFDPSKLSAEEQARVAQRKTEGRFPRDFTMMIVEIISNWDKVSESTREAIRPYVNPDAIHLGIRGLLPRVAALTGEKTYTTTNFEIHYSTTDADNYVNSTDISPPNGIPDFVETVGSALEYSYGAEIANMNFPQPPKESGESRYIIYMLDTLDSEYAYGFAVPMSETFPSAAEIMLDHDFHGKTDDMKVTCAHEFFHAVQFGTPMILNASDWLWEATAVWMEDEVYSNINEYIDEYLNGDYGWFDYPEYSLDNADKNYGGAIFFKYFSEALGLTDAVKKILEYCQSETIGISAVKKYLQIKGLNLQDVFQWFSESLVTLSEYKDGYLYDGAAITQTIDMTNSDYGAVSGYVIYHLGTRVFKLWRGSAASNDCLKFRFSSSANIRVSILKKKGSNFGDIDKISIGTAEKRMCDFGKSYDAFYLVIANTSETNDNPSYSINIEKLHPTSFDVSVTCHAWNLICLSIEPVTSDYTDTISGYPFDLYLFTASEYLSDASDFFAYFNGNVYWIYSECAQNKMTVKGFNTTDQSYTYSLYKGWNAIGNPFLTDVAWGDGKIMITVGTTTYTLSQAITNHIVSDKLYYYEPSSGYKTMTANSGNYLEAWKGYLIKADQTASIQISK